MARMSRETRQKNIIRSAISLQDGYFTASTLASSIQKKHPSIGIATVYRYLARARKTGELHSYLCNGETLYSTEKRSHCHFTCETCKKTEHLHIKDLSSLDKQITGDMCHVQIDITGVCKDCKQA